MEENQKGISIMSFNILFENPIDYFSNNKNSWNNRREHVVNLLKKYDSDIFCLQECIFTQLTYIKNNFPEYEYFGARQDSLHWSDINPIFFKRDKYEFIKGETSWYSKTPNIPGSKSYGNWIPRTFSWALLKNKNESYQTLIVNTHLDVFSQDSRELSMIQLTEFIKNFEDPFEIILLTGDFNSLKNSDIFSLLEDESLYLIDSVCWGDDSVNTTGTFHNFGSFTKYRIDYIFYGDKNSIIRKGNYKVIQDLSPQGKFISDHYPVFIELFNDT